MNQKQFDRIAAYAVRNGMSFAEAVDFCMLHGTGDDVKAKAERDAWNAEVDRRKAAKKAWR